VSQWADGADSSIGEGDRGGNGTAVGIDCTDSKDDVSDSDANEPDSTGDEMDIVVNETDNGFDDAGCDEDDADSNANEPDIITIGAMRKKNLGMCRENRGMFQLSRNMIMKI
jgi:hypothetical protein